MFFTCFKYTLIDYLRTKAIIFWVVIFPMLLGTLFIFAFMSIYDNENKFNEIPVAIIEGEQEGGIKPLIEEMEKNGTKLLSAQYVSEEKAHELLKDGEIYGIIYDDLTDPALTIRSNSIRTSIVKSFLERYRVNASIVQDILKKDPSKIQEVLESMELDSDSILTEKSLGSGNMNPYTAYFYNLLAMSCMFVSMIGMYTAIYNQANLSLVGARSSVSPASKLTKITASLLSAFVIFSIGVGIATAFLFYVLGIDFGISFFEALLVDVFGVMIGLSLGFFVGCIGRMNESMKIAILLAVSLVSGMLSGLMMGDMPMIIEQNCPIINRINPSRLISDCFYTLNSYGFCERFFTNIITLVVMTVLFIIGGFLIIRKRKFKSL